MDKPSPLQTESENDDSEEEEEEQEGRGEEVLLHMLLQRAVDKSKSDHNQNFISRNYELTDSTPSKMQNCVCHFMSCTVLYAAAKICLTRCLTVSDTTLIAYISVQSCSLKKSF